MQTRGSSKLSVSKRKELILSLCQVLSTLSSSNEVAEAITDLLTPKEIETIAKRLHIAEMLVEGKGYDSIRDDLSVGYSTIARINTWLNLSGSGYKILLSRKKKIVKQELGIEDKYDPYSFGNLKRRYSLYFWPELLLDEFLKSANTKEKRKMEDIFEKIELKKRRFTSEENKKLFNSFSSSIKTLENTSTRK